MNANTKVYTKAQEFEFLRAIKSLEYSINRRTIFDMRDKQRDALSMLCAKHNIDLLQLICKCIRLEF